jgi:hypothetical protein
MNLSNSQSERTKLAKFITLTGQEEIGLQKNVIIQKLSTMTQHL